MSFKLNIENFGKLSNEEVRIGQFTVFAGPNSTGKSSVSKLLYSLFDGMNANHASVHFKILASQLRNELAKLEFWEDEDESLPSYLLNEEINKMENFVRKCSINDPETTEEKWNQTTNCAKNLRKIYREVKTDIEEWLLKQEERSLITTSTESIETALNELCGEIETTNAHQLVTSGIRDKISENLIQNFQVSNISSLRTEQEKPSKVRIDGVGSFELKNSNSVGFHISRAGLKKLQDYSRVIYLESPIYWKLQSALKKIRISPRFSIGRKELVGVPGYFYDLAEALEAKYSGDSTFSEMYEKLKKVIGGKLTISETGELRFQENERSFSLHLTAMGVINLGMLALLIERKIIDEGTFLFIDEPEAHLHPSWQIKITRTLFELSRLGVNVVIATHSADILKFLEVEVKKNPESKEFIELNHFTSDGVKNYGDDFDSNLAKIKEELTDPYTKLYFAGL